MAIKRATEELAPMELQQANRIIMLYRKNKDIIESLSQRFGFHPYFVMQPNLFTKDKLSRYERDFDCWRQIKEVKFHNKVYELARKEFCNDSNFYDISDCIKTDETIYFDDCHMSIKGTEIVAKVILETMGNDIIKRSR